VLISELCRPVRLGLRHAARPGGPGRVVGAGSGSDLQHAGKRWEALQATQVSSTREQTQRAGLSALRSFDTFWYGIADFFRLQLAARQGEIGTGGGA
jgi:hypothetical protein